MTDGNQPADHAAGYGRHSSLDGAEGQPRLRRLRRRRRLQGLRLGHQGRDQPGRHRQNHKTPKAALFILFCSALQAQKLEYGNPSDVQMDSVFMHQKVDAIITNAIQKQAFPGVQILVAKKHKIIFHKFDYEINIS